jgi:uncharacterized membrane protein
MPMRGRSSARHHRGMTDDSRTAGKPASRPSTASRAPLTRADWLIPLGLILLTLVPALGGALRLSDLAGGEVTADNARFFAAPLPVVVHILASVPYCLLGAFQFAPGLRRRRPHWHRNSGRVLVLLGLASALTGIWMTLFYQPMPEMDGTALYLIRLLVGTAMALALVLAYIAVRGRDIPRHRAWMIRAYALGQGAGTQVFTHLPWTLTLSDPSEFGHALAMGGGWAINIIAAEWIIRRPGVSVRSRRPGTPKSPR